MQWLFLRQFFIYLIQNTEDVLLAERAADAVAVEVHIGQVFGALDAQVGKPPALHDSVYRLLSIFFNILPVGFEAPVGPSMSPTHRLFLILIIGRGAGALVERKNNISAEAVLYFYRTLRRKAMERAVDMRSKRNSFLIDDGELAVRCCQIFVVNSWSRTLPPKRSSGRLYGLNQTILSRRVLLLPANFRNFFTKPFAKRKDLEPARVGHNRTVKTHKLMDSARFFYQLRPGRKVQVVRVGDDGLDAKRTKLGRFNTFDIRFGSHGNERWGLYIAVRRAQNARTRKARTIFLYVEPAI